MEWTACDQTRVYSKAGLGAAPIPDSLASELDHLEDYGIATPYRREKALSNAKHELSPNDKVKSRYVSAADSVKDVDDVENEKEVNKLLTTFTALTEADIRALDAM